MEVLDWDFFRIFMLRVQNQPKSTLPVRRITQNTSQLLEAIKTNMIHWNLRFYAFIRNGCLIASRLTIQSQTDFAFRPSQIDKINKVFCRFNRQPKNKFPLQMQSLLRTHEIFINDGRWLLCWSAQNWKSCAFNSRLSWFYFSFVVEKCIKRRWIWFHLF